MGFLVPMRCLHDLRVCSVCHGTLIVETRRRSRLSKPTRQRSPKERPARSPGSGRRGPAPGTIYGSRLPQDKQDEIRAALLAGGCLNTVAKATGVSRDRVRTIAKVLRSEGHELRTDCGGGR